MDSFALRRSLRNIKNMIVPTKRSPKKKSSSNKKSLLSYSLSPSPQKPPLHPKTYKNRIVRSMNEKLGPGIALNKTRKSK
jgi:hypothetical protein